jgi:carboxylesterase
VRLASQRAFGPIARPLRRYLRPADMATVRPGVEAFYSGAGRLGVLLLHGFTGSPRSMRPWAEHLAADGFRVALPRLPGHGTTWQELHTTSWNDLHEAAEAEFKTLTSECDKVFIAALSVGSALALRLAEQYGEQVAGLSLVNPIVTQKDSRYRLIPVLRRIVPTLPVVANDIAKPEQDEGGYLRMPLNTVHSLVLAGPQLRADLPKITSPLLIFKSRIDHVVGTSSVPFIVSSVSSSDVTVMDLDRSYHVATLDYDAELIFTTSSSFFGRLGKD